MLNLSKLFCFRVQFLFFWIFNFTKITKFTYKKFTYRNLPIFLNVVFFHKIVKLKLVILFSAKFHFFPFSILQKLREGVRGGGGIDYVGTGLKCRFLALFGEKKTHIGLFKIITYWLPSGGTCSFEFCGKLQKVESLFAKFNQFSWIIYKK